MDCGAHLAPGEEGFGGDFIGLGREIREPTILEVKVLHTEQGGDRDYMFVRGWLLSAMSCTTQQSIIICIVNSGENEGFYSSPLGSQRIPTHATSTWAEE